MELHCCWLLIPVYIIANGDTLICGKVWLIVAIDSHLSISLIVTEDVGITTNEWSVVPMMGDSLPVMNDCIATKLLPMMDKYIATNDGEMAEIIKSILKDREGRSHSGLKIISPWSCPAAKRFIFGWAARTQKWSGSHFYPLYRWLVMRYCYWKWIDDSPFSHILH